jgi:hypothetical protein
MERQQGKNIKKLSLRVFLSCFFYSMFCSEVQEEWKEEHFFLPVYTSIVVHAAVPFSKTASFVSACASVGAAAGRPS